MQAYNYIHTQNISEINFYFVCMMYACDDFSVVAMCMHC